jgi:phosphoheptose isomerase
MDLQPKIAEAIEEHLTVIRQLTAMSHLILQVASELVATLRRQGKVVLCGNGGVPAMRNILLPKCRVSARIQGHPRDCWRSS